VTAATARDRPGSLAEVAASVRAGRQSFAHALSEFLDEFYLRPERRRAMLAQRPAPLSDPHEHAFLGAAAEHLARRWGLEPPAWADEPDRFLRRAYFPTPIEDLKAMLLVQSPLAFRRRLIFVEAEPLRRARMPAG
jgi:hypothetical protein